MGFTVIHKKTEKWWHFSYHTPMENKHDARWHRTLICPSESVIEQTSKVQAYFYTRMFHRTWTIRLSRLESVTIRQARPQNWDFQKEFSPVIFSILPFTLGDWEAEKKSFGGSGDTRECFHWQHITTQGCLESVHHNHRGNTFALMDKQVNLSCTEFKARAFECLSGFSELQLLTQRASKGI